VEQNDELTPVRGLGQSALSVDLRQANRGSAKVVERLSSRLVDDLGSSAVGQEEGDEGTSQPRDSDQPNCDEDDGLAHSDPSQGEIHPFQDIPAPDGPNSTLSTVQEEYEGDGETSMSQSRTQSRLLQSAVSSSHLSMLRQSQMNASMAASRSQEISTALVAKKQEVNRASTASPENESFAETSSSSSCASEDDRATTELEQSFDQHLQEALQEHHESLHSSQS